MMYFTIYFTKISSKTLNTIYIRFIIDGKRYDIRYKAIRGT